MNSRILHGQTRHCRFLPRRHAFDYPMRWLFIDVDELPLLNRQISLLGYNRQALFSLRDADYGGNHAGNVRQKIESLLLCNGVIGPMGKILLVTLPRVLGYAFNPVSFFLCYCPGGDLAALIAEVRNTVGQGHHYVLQPEAAGLASKQPIRFLCPKTFYVSPFLPVRGEYEVLLAHHDESLSVTIHLRQGDQPIFSADMVGQCRPLTSRSLAASALALSWAVITVMSRITWQAARLYLQRKLPIFANPGPTSPATYQPSRIGAWHRARKKFFQFVDRRSSVPAVGVFVTTQKDSLS